MEKEYTLWGVKIGEPDYMEDLLLVDNEEIVINKKLTDWLKSKGYDRLRVSKIDMREKPDFTKAIKKDEGGEVDNEYFVVECNAFGFIPNILGSYQHQKLSDAFETLFDFLNGDNGLEWMKDKGVIFSIEKNYIDKDGREKFKQVYKISGKEALDLYNRRMLENGGEIPDNIINILKEKRAISDRVDKSSKILNDIANSDERPMGLVSERVRSSKEYMNAKREYDDAFAKLRSFNSSEKGKTLEKYMKKKGMAERIRINKMRFNYGGTINQSINTNIMDNHKFNQLPHINTISEGDDVIIEESVFVGGERPKHVGERYIHCKVMGMGGMVDSLNLEVVKSVGFNPFEQGRMITRPIKNVLQRGRRLIVEPIADAITSKMGLDDLFVGDEVSYKGNSYKVGGMTDCHNYVKANNIKSGVDEEIDVDDLMSNSTLIKRSK